MTVESVLAASPGVARQRLITVGCRVGNQQKPSSGIVQSGCPMFSPKEKNAVCWLALAFAAGSVRCRTCVKPGSVSISTRTGIDSIHGRNGFTHDTFNTTSAVAHNERAMPVAGPDQRS